MILWCEGALRRLLNGKKIVNQQLAKKNEQMWKQLDQQNKELEEKRKQFEKEKAQYEEEQKSNDKRGLERSDSSSRSLK